MPTASGLDRLTHKGHVQKMSADSTLASDIGTETPFVARVLRRTVEATSQSPCRHFGTNPGLMTSLTLTPTLRKTATRAQMTDANFDSVFNLAGHRPLKVLPF